MKWELGDKNIQILIGKQEDNENPNGNIEESILEEYKKNFDRDLSIVHNCDDYTTLQYQEADILRLKYSDNTKWIKILIIPKYKQKYIDSPLFENQKNKNQIFWISRIERVEDLDKYIDIIKEDLEFRDKES